MADERGLLCHHLWIVEGPERGAVAEPGEAGSSVAVDGEAGVVHQDLVVVDPVLHGAGCWTRRGLEQSVVDVRYAGPAAAVVRHAHHEFMARRPALYPGLHGGRDGEVRGHRVAGRLTQRGLLVGLRLPGAVEVVPLQRGEVEVAEDLPGLEAVVDVRRVGRQERGELEVLVHLVAVRVQLVAELVEQLGVVGLVLRPGGAADQVVGRPFPVDVEAVEHAGRDSRAAATAVEDRQVALDEQVYAGGDEGAAGLFGQSGVGEEPRPGEAADRHQYFEPRVPGLELAQLVEVAGEGLAPRVGHAVDGLGSGRGALVVGPGVAEPGRVDLEAFAVGADVGEGVVDVGQFAGLAGCFDPLDEVTAVDAPLGEVAHLLQAVAAPVVGRSRPGTGTAG